MTKLLSGLIFLLLLATPLWAQSISVSQSLDKSSMGFDDSVRFEIVLKWEGSQTAYLFTKPLDPSFDNLKIRSYSSSVGSSITDGKEITTRKFDFILEPTSAGVGRIEPVDIGYISWPDSLPGQLVTEVVTVNISSPRVVEPPGRPAWWIWLIIVVVAVGAFFAAIFFARRRSRAVEEPVKTAREEFLDKLKSVKNAAGSDMKVFQTELHRSLVQFLRGQYNFDPVNLSEDSLIEELKTAGLDDFKARKIGGWLVRAGKDKYSPISSGPGETIRLESEIRDFFEKL
ncbi:MAG: BatD family protein [Candidatus Zixiibacteriota bacterium]